jgi:hypothetical protein
LAIAATATGDDSHGAQRRLGIAEGIFERICTIVGDTFAAVSPEQTTFMALPNCFELFGFDFLIGAQARQIEVCLSLARSRSRWLGLTSNKRHSLRSSGAPRVWGGAAWCPRTHFAVLCACVVAGEDGHVWLLEANAEPDFKQTGTRLQVCYPVQIVTIYLPAVHASTCQRVSIDIVWTDHAGGGGDCGGSYTGADSGCLGPLSYGGGVWRGCGGVEDEGDRGCGADGQGIRALSASTCCWLLSSALVEIGNAADCLARGLWAAAGACVRAHMAEWRWCISC